MAPSAWSLPGDPQKPVRGSSAFLRIADATCLNVEPLGAGQVPVVNSVVGPPIAQPSLLPGLRVVMGCNSPSMIVLTVPFLISLKAVHG